MLAVVSPAKKLDFETDVPEMSVSQPAFLDDTEELVDVARKKSRSDLMKLMGISENLADLNYQRFQHFSRPFDRTNAKPAIFAFRGDTYVGLDADTMKAEDIDWAEGHFRMLSGLYGLLKPRDLMQHTVLKWERAFRTRGAKTFTRSGMISFQKKSTRLPKVTGTVV